MLNDDRKPVVIGVLSDTHGLLRASALRALQGVTAILHAGDIGSSEVLGALEAIATVTAVRGNIDRGDWTSGLSNLEVVELAESQSRLSTTLGNSTSARCALGWAS